MKEKDIDQIIIIADSIPNDSRNLLMDFIHEHLVYAEVIRKCAEKFREYEKHHKRKKEKFIQEVLDGTDDIPGSEVIKLSQLQMKEIKNKELAEMCEEVLKNG